MGSYEKEGEALRFGACATEENDALGEPYIHAYKMEDSSRTLCGISTGSMIDYGEQESGEPSCLRCLKSFRKLQAREKP
jgi:hypothetical protein